MSLKLALKLAISYRRHSHSPGIMTCQRVFVPEVVTWLAIELKQTDLSLCYPLNLLLQISLFWQHKNGEFQSVCEVHFVVYFLNDRAFVNKLTYCIINKCPVAHNILNKSKHYMCSMPYSPLTFLILFFSYNILFCSTSYYAMKYPL